MKVTALFIWKNNVEERILISFCLFIFKFHKKLPHILLIQYCRHDLNFQWKYNQLKIMHIYYGIHKDQLKLRSLFLQLRKLQKYHEIYN